MERTANTVVPRSHLHTTGRQWPQSVARICAKQSLTSKYTHTRSDRTIVRPYNFSFRRIYVSLLYNVCSYLTRSRISTSYDILLRARNDLIESSADTGNDTEVVGIFWLKPWLLNAQLIIVVLLWDTENRRSILIIAINLQLLLFDWGQCCNLKGWVGNRIILFEKSISSTRLVSDLWRYKTVILIIH